MAARKVGKADRNVQNLAHSLANVEISVRDLDRKVPDLAHSLVDLARRVRNADDKVANVARKVDDPARKVVNLDLWASRAWTPDGPPGTSTQTMNPASLFATVPERDLLQFGQGESFNAKRVADWMDLDKQTVSRVAGVPKSSVRYDENIPRAVREQLEEIASIANMVAIAFDGDGAKTALWCRTKNPMLGDIAPRDMVRLGRYERLRKFVVSAIGSQRTIAN